MKHRVGYNRLGRMPAHRKALHRNMVTSLFLEERITTTKAKARAIRRTAEKMVTRGKEDSVHNRRIVGKLIKNEKALAKLFTEIGPRFKNRPGGYTRMLKLGPRFGDAAEMVILEFVERGNVKDEKPRKKRAAKKAEPEAVSENEPAEVAENT